MDDKTSTAQPTPSTVQKEVKSEKPPVILIVEDDPILLKMYSEKFTFEGFSVLNARDGEEALKVAVESSPDIILLDIMLPKMSGTDFLEKYRGVDSGKNTPVLALTNLAEEEEKQKALKLGVKEYLVKAMQTPEQVVEKIKKYLPK
jgi:two-component system alkaline phosphatase synthesis response regulator PhoP